MYVSLIRRPCKTLLGISVFGPHPCGNLTHYRRRDGIFFIPQCYDCAHAWEEPPVVEPKKYDLELGIYKSLYDRDVNPNYDRYREVEIDNTCGYGCKIYENETNGQRVLAHNSAYGCRKI